MTFDEKFKLIAEKELREDDSRKSQALEQFRDWLDKQVHIKNCRKDDNFLLRYLRTKKYQSQGAYKLIETQLVRSQVFPQWFKKTTFFDDERIKDIFETGYLLPLAERDQHGRRVTLMRVGKFDTSKFKFPEHVKLVTFVLQTLLEEEETQIAGFSHIVDFKDVTMDYLGIFGLLECKNYFRFADQALPARHKQVVFLNVPSFGVKLIEFILQFVSKKIRDRCTFVETSKLDTIYDPKILPLEYGGKVSCDEMMNQFKKLAEDRLEKLQAIDKIEVDAEFVKKHEDAIEPDDGSFRKLEID